MNEQDREAEVKQKISCIIYIVLVLLLLLYWEIVFERIDMHEQVNIYRYIINGQLKKLTVLVATKSAI